MMYPTHLLSGAVLAESLLLANQVPIYPPYLFDPYVLSVSVPVAGASLAGAVFPDIDLRLPMVEHRTVTHWPLPYLLGAILGWWFSSTILFCFSSGCLLHILLDAFTKVGVPVFFPNGKRYGWRLLRVGSGREVLVVVALAGLAVGAWHLVRG